MGRGSSRAERLREMERLYYQRAYSDAEMAKRLGVNRTTVYRDRLELERHVPLVEEAPGKWRIDRRAYISQIRVNIKEALTLYIAARREAQRMRSGYPSMASALEKLALALRKPMSERLVRSAEKILSKKVNRTQEAVFETIAHAWVDQLSVRVRYQGLETRIPYWDRVDPYLIEPAPWSDSIYLIGPSEVFAGIVTYRLDRILEARLTTTRFEVPSDFDEEALLRYAWGIWHSVREPQWVVLKFSPGPAAKRARESVWHPLEQWEKADDGGYIWRAPIAEWREMLPWIRGWGADVEVLEPEELRAALRRETRRLMHLYLPDPRPRPPHLYLWSKARRDDGAYHPLLYHLLDVAACAEGLWEHALTLEARAQLARDLNLSEDEVRRMFLFLAAAHDIGKASPAFQTKITALREALRELGYDFPDAAENGTPHGVISAWALRAWLQENLSWHKRTAHRLAHVVGAHHGVWPASVQIVALDDKRLADVGREPLWAESRNALLAILAEVFNPPRGVRMPTDTEVQNRILALLAGFITVADWLGSMGDFFPYEDRVFTAEEYLPIARQQAQQALQATGWLQAWQAEGEPQPFERVFPFTPNAIQAEGIRLAQDISHPALLIVEAPTGQGKTELALYLADAWLQAQAGRGLYIAMPTQATSNAMYTRLRGFLQRRYPNQGFPVVLAHGRADDVLPRLQGVGEGSDDAVSAASWFLPRKRALLASFGVGTVDQALIGALQARHHYLRLFGLAHKVVIFDEVHAYDTYMEHLFLRLLTWLRAVGASVIVLSATLPRSTREALVKAWGGVEQSLGSAPYPRLTLVTSGRIGEHPLPPPRERTVALGWLEENDPEALAAWLEKQLVQGGCAAVICNTVERAQEVYAALQERFPPQERLLFHARMPFAWREEKEKQVLALFGKEDAQRPKRFVLVATQVIEQSLDLDFDLMVSELAPVDLVIQRAGRLHRHPNRRRPAGLETPQLWLLRPHGNLTEPEFGPSRHIYAPYILWRTYLALRGREALRLPFDTDALIEAVYRPWQAEMPDPLLDAFPDAAQVLAKGLSAAWADWQQETLHQHHEATKRLIPPANGTVTLADGVNDALDDDEEALKHPDLKALTRLIAPGVTLLPLHRQPDGRLTLEPTGGLEVNLDERPSRLKAREMRRFLVTVQHRGLVRSPDLPDVPSAWQRVAGLRGVVPVVFEQGRAHVGAWTLTLDKDFGLRIRKEET